MTAAGEGAVRHVSRRPPGGEPRRQATRHDPIDARRGGGGGGATGPSGRPLHGAWYSRAADTRGRRAGQGLPAGRPARARPGHGVAPELGLGEKISSSQRAPGRTAGRGTGGCRARAGRLRPVPSHVAGPWETAEENPVPRPGPTRARVPARPPRRAPSAVLRARAPTPRRNGNPENRTTERPPAARDPRGQARGRAGATDPRADRRRSLSSPLSGGRDLEEKGRGGASDERADPRRDRGRGRGALAGTPHAARVGPHLRSEPRSRGRGHRAGRAAGEGDGRPAASHPPSPAHPRRPRPEGRRRALVDPPGQPAQARPQPQPLPQ